MARYLPGLQRELAALGRSHPNLADLLTSFPAAAIAIVQQRGWPQDRGEAIWRARRGGSLLSIAEALDLPYFSRKLPPEGLGEGISDQLGFDNLSPKFYRRLAQQVPRSFPMIKQWVAAVNACAELGDEDYALWYLGNQDRPWRKRRPMPRLLPAFHFFSNNPHYPAADCIINRCADNTAYSRARYSCTMWFLNLLFTKLIDSGRQHPIIRETSFYDSFRITPLFSAKDLHREAGKMKNCVSSYWQEALCFRSLIFHYADETQEHATFELKIEKHGRRCRLNEARGPANSEVSGRAKANIDNFVRFQLEPELENIYPTLLHIDLVAWETLFSPFAESFPANSLPAAPTPEDVRQLVREVAG
ncbi:MAG: hypothetical protein MRY74_04950 [Neomegalonema sp.]|nr:hypothetical protein [Neomegalonema sp.]